PQGPNTFFSIDRFSATNGFGTKGLASDILISSGNGSFSIFADSKSMGLDPGDQIDGLVLDVGSTTGVLTPGVDHALFTLDPLSPDTFTANGTAYQPGVRGALSPADVLWTDFTGRFKLWARADSLGLLPGDHVDALGTMVPEP